MRLLSRRNTDTRINNSAALPGRHRENGIEVDLAYFRKIFDHRGDAEKDFFDGLNIGRRVASISLQETVAPDFSNHFAGVPVRQRRNSAANVSQNLDVNAT